MFLITFRCIILWVLLGTVAQNWPKINVEGMAIATPSYAVCQIIIPKATRAMKRRHREPVILSIVLLMAFTA